MPGNTSSSAHKKRIRIQDVSDSEDSVCRNSSDSDDEVVHSAKKKSRRLQLSDDDEEEKENRQSDEDGGEPEEDDSHRKSSRINLMEGRKRRQSLVFEKLKTPKRERLEAVGKDDSDHDEPDESDYNRIKTSEDDTDEDSQSGFVVSDTEEIEIEEEGEEEEEEISPTKKVSLKHSKKPVIDDDDDDEDEEKDENGGAEVSDSDSIKMLSSSSDSESDASDEEDNVTDIHKTAEMPWKTTLTTYEAFMLVLEMLLNAVFDPEFLHPWNLENHNSVIRPAFQKISDEVHARKVIVDSQAWGRAYREALESHPRMKESDLSYSTTDCEACNRRDHPATRDILFTGNMYDEVTLQPLGEEEEQESDSGEEREEKYRGDNPANGSIFEVGRHCATRSSLYHCLYHYKYDLMVACRKKVKKMQTRFPDDESSDIIIKCMGDKLWIEDQFKFLQSCLNAAEQYTEDAKPDSSNLGKRWRPRTRVGGLGFR